MRIGVLQQRGRVLKLLHLQPAREDHADPPSGLGVSALSCCVRPLGHAVRALPFTGNRHYFLASVLTLMTDRASRERHNREHVRFALVILAPIALLIVAALASQCRGA